MVAPSRVAAFEVLRAVESAGTPLGDALASHRARLHQDRDRALASEIALGTLRWRAAIDFGIETTAGRSLDRLDPPVLYVLRLSAYQLLHLQRVPASAVVDDAVDLTRRAGHARASGFVNAVLRGLSRQRKRIPWPAKPPASSTGDSSARERALDFLSVTLSQPRWLAARWLDRYGLEAAESWARFNNGHAPLTLRVNTLRTTRDDLIGRLHRAGITATPTGRAPHGVIASSAHAGAEPAGQFVVQDESSQLITELVRARPGERVLDTCASPGNKTIALACDLRDSGLLVATDMKRRRVNLLEKTVRASGAHCIHVVQADLTRPPPFRVEFDAVLVDAPCSGLGTIRRDPDIKWRRQESDLVPLADAQQRLLNRAAAVVRPGGRLIYATCSSEPEENDQVVEAFLRDRPEFSKHDWRSAPDVPASIRELLDPSAYFRTLPHLHDLEGFFGAVLIRNRSK